jgi:multicomponent Na+:H+ antiporter subunit E
VLSFFFYYIFELIKSNISVIKLSLFGKPDPVIVDVSTEGLSDFQAWLFGSLITMTPGTLTIEQNERSLSVQFLDRTAQEGFYETFRKRFYKAWGVSC